MQFARVAHAVGFLYCYSILEANRRAASHAPADGGGGGKVPTSTTTPELSAELHSFFPFDPYALPRSAAYIEGVYRDWASVAIGDGGEDDEESADEDGGEGEDGASEAGSMSDGTPRTPLDEVVSASFGGMSISPARPLAMS
jgi:RNA polymerase I-specific transcription initiation factor RRN3